MGVYSTLYWVHYIAAQTSSQFEHHYVGGIDPLSNATLTIYIVYNCQEAMGVYSTLYWVHYIAAQTSSQFEHHYVGGIQRYLDNIYCV